MKLQEQRKKPQPSLNLSKTLFFLWKFVGKIVDANIGR